MMKKKLFTETIFIFFLCFAGNSFSQSCDITGNETISANSYNSYNVLVEQGYQYFWSVQGDLELFSGQSTNQISVKSGSGSGSGKICITKFKEDADPCCNCLDVNISNMNQFDQCFVNAAFSSCQANSENLIVLSPSLDIGNPYSTNMLYTYQFLYNGNQVHSGTGIINANSILSLNQINFNFNLSQNNASFPLAFEVIVVITDFFDPGTTCTVSDSIILNECEGSIEPVSCIATGKIFNCDIVKNGNVLEIGAYFSQLQNPFNNPAIATIYSENIGGGIVSPNSISLAANQTTSLQNVTFQINQTNIGNEFITPGYYWIVLKIVYTDTVTGQICTTRLYLRLDKCDGGVGGTLDKTAIRSSKQIFVVPNPVENNLKLEFNSKVEYSKIEIFDLNGRKIKTEYHNEHHQYNITDLINGMYIVKIINDSYTIQEEKFIKK